MYKKHTSDEARRKRKARNRGKKEWKRTKFPSPGIFAETGFDSSDDDELLLNESYSPSKSNSLISQFEQSINITPSKSENEVFLLASDSEEDKVEISDVSCSFNERNFDISSDEDKSVLYDSVTEVFQCGNIDYNGTEIVSARISFPSEETAIEAVELKKKKEETNVENNSPKKRTKVESSNYKENFNNLLSGDVQCNHTKDGAVVVLQKNQIVYVHGLCLLSVLHGQVEILGHTLTKNSPEVKLFSPRGSSLLYLKNVTETNLPAANYFSHLKLQLTEKCAVLLCRILDDSKISFIEKHISQQILPIEDSHFPRIVFQPREGNFNLLQENKNWGPVIDRIQENTKLMICGGKGVGKTTFLRYTVNKLLMKFAKVRVVDLDPGQSEFTIPGVISIVDVDKPVFGVNYTHLQRPRRSVLSNINIAYEPDQYVRSVQELLDTDLDQIPTLINYMGYTHGIGINILSAVIACVEPTEVLQICSKESKKNYKCLLNVDVVRENAKLFVTCGPNLNYNLWKIDSMCDGSDGWTAEPRQLREMCILSYVSNMIGSSTIFNIKGPMYRISLSDIKICDLKKENIHPAAVNACLVSLCQEREKCFECLGWGIVRGIDLVSNELVLITSEEFEILDTITHLVSNGATLPPSLYMTPDKVSGSMPYVAEGHLTSLGQIPKRSHVAVKQK